jgi:hypothetical protein
MSAEDPENPVTVFAAWFATGFHPEEDYANEAAFQEDLLKQAKVWVQQNPLGEIHFPGGGE